MAGAPLVAVAPPPAAPPALSLQWLVPAVTTGSRSARLAATCAARDPDWRVRFDQVQPALRSCTPELAWSTLPCNSACTLPMHALASSLMDGFSWHPNMPNPVTFYDSILDVGPAQTLLRKLEELSFPYAMCRSRAHLVETMRVFEPLDDPSHAVVLNAASFLSLPAEDTAHADKTFPAGLGLARELSSMHFVALSVGKPSLLALCHHNGVYGAEHPAIPLPVDYAYLFVA